MLPIPCLMQNTASTINCSHKVWDHFAETKNLRGQYHVNKITMDRNLHPGQIIKKQEPPMSPHPTVYFSGCNENL